MSAQFAATGQSAERESAPPAARDRPESSAEDRHRHIVEAAGVSIWEEDFSMVGAALDALRARGVTDLGAYLAAHPEFVRSAIGLVKIVDVNPATLHLLGAREKSELMASLHDVFLPETAPVFAQELLAIWEGRALLEAETVLRTLQGERRDVMFSIAFPAARAGLASVPVTLTDITARKRAETRLLRSERGLRALYLLASAVGRAETLKEVYALALDALIGAVCADRASVLLFDDRGVMRFAAWRGLSADYRAAAEGHSPWTSEQRNAAPITVADVAEDTALGALRERILAEGIRALAFIPLDDGGCLLGKFMIYHDRPHAFGEDELHLAESIASQSRTRSSAGATRRRCARASRSCRSSTRARRRCSTPRIARAACAWRTRRRCARSA